MNIGCCLRPALASSMRKEATRKNAAVLQNH
jgi:hypothetical protein